MLHGLWVCLATLLLTAPAGAQPPADAGVPPADAAATGTPATPPPADSTEHARVLFQEGVAAGDHHDWATAAAKFREALLLHDAPAIRYNLGSALVELHRDDEAEPHLQHVVDDSSAPPDLHHQAASLLDAIHARHPAPAPAPAPTAPTPAETAAAAPAGDGVLDGDQGSSAHDNLFVWVAAGGAAVLVITTVIIVIAVSSGEDRVEGNLHPGVVVLR